MKKHAVKHLFVLCLFWSYSEVLSAQLMKIVDCSVQLEQAIAAFDQEKYDEVPPLLSYCADRDLREYSNLKKSQRLQANRMLVISYLALGDQLGAKTIMTDLLEEFPGYNLSNSDPPEFQTLYDQFEINPARSLEFSIGATSSFFDLQTLYTFSGNPATNEMPQYTGERGISLGINGQFELLGKLYLYSGIQYRTNHFKFREEVRGRVFLTTEEKQQLLGIPLGLRYYFDLGKVSIFPDASLAANFLLSANADFSGEDLNAERNLAENNYDLRFLRQQQLWSGAIGLGIHIPTAAKSLGIVVKYHSSFGPFTQANSTSFELSRDYNFLENEVTYDYLSVHLFFRLNDYKLKKIKYK